MKMPNIQKYDKREKNMGIKNWEETMHSALRTAINDSPYDAVNLYLKLEKASKDYLKNGDMKEGDVFRVPLETGIMLDVSFYKDHSTVIANYPNGKREYAINRNDSFNKEYRYLDAITKGLETANLGIGPKYSDEFFNLMSKAKPGDVFVFDNGVSLVCEGKMLNMLSFVEVSKNINVPYIEDFAKQNRIPLNLDDPNSIQKMYREVKDNYTNDVKMSITSVTNARGVLNKLIANKDITKEFSIGPNKFIAQKEKDGKGLVYYSNGNKISETKMLTLLAWLDASPNKVEIKDIRPSLPSQEFSDMMFKRTLDEIMSKHEFEKGLELISGYCLNNPEVLQVDMFSYLENKLDYEAVRFAFKFEDNNLSIKKITYEDNDFNKNPIKIEKQSFEDVIDYCKAKYDDKFNYIKNNMIEEIHKEYPKWQSEFFHKILDDYIENKLKEDSVIDLNITNANKDISSFMEVDL